MLVSNYRAIFPANVMKVQCFMFPLLVVTELNTKRFWKYILSIEKDILLKASHAKEIGSILLAASSKNSIPRLDISQSYQITDTL